MHAPADLIDWLKLALTPGVGPSSFHQLIAAFASPGAVLGAAESDFERIPKLKRELLREILNTQRGARDEAAKREIDEIESRGIGVLTVNSPEYPSRLREIAAPPQFLFYRGAFRSAEPHPIAIVGTRRCDSYGLRMTRKIAGELASAGLPIVSGLALGVDSAAHQGALAVGGETWAFLPGGFGCIYPPENLSLADEIAEKGIVLTERTLSAQPIRASFPARNRLVSGVSVGVLVVQAPLKSGALITARLAMEQNREVFALPGRVDEPSSLGPHRLIQDGAKLINSTEDILIELNMLVNGTPVSAQKALPKPPPTVRSGSPPTARGPIPSAPYKPDRPEPTDPIDRKIVLRLEPGPAHIDRISGDLDIPVKTLSERLLLLEMQGIVRRLPGMAFELND